MMSPRMSFQWQCVQGAKGPILNVGCADDPLHFEKRCTHFDIDDWSRHFSRLGQVFVQGDAQHLTDYFGPGSFDLVILGDVLEHIPEPYKALQEAAIVTSRALCLTIWEEWRISEGLHIDDGQQQADEEARSLGFDNRLVHQEVLYPDKVGYPEEDMPHLIHIWHFTDQDISEMVSGLVVGYHMWPKVATKTPEVVHAGHQVYNWLILLEKERDDTISKT